MFCKLYHRFIVLDYIKSSFSTVRKEQWDLVSSVCLERKPIITKKLNSIEQKYLELVQNVELEMSYKSDHEVKLLKDKLIAEELKKKDTFIDIDKIAQQTAQEFEDASNEELKKFKFADRTTDEEDNVLSTNRKLSDSLFLIVKRSLGQKPIWLFPQSVHQEGETMRQTAERALNEICGTNLKSKFLGNAPCGFYKYRYPKKANIEQSVGMKIFFFKAQLCEGNVSKDVCRDFQWLSSKELNILHEDYLKNVKMFLIDINDEVEEIS